MNLVLLKCTSCGGNLSVEQGGNILNCPYCGHNTLIVESDEVRIAQIEEETDRIISADQTQLERERMQLEHEIQARKEKSDSKVTIGLVILLGLCLLTPFIMIFHYEFTETHVPNASKHYIGEYYYDVEAQLSDAGFKDIEVTALGDLSDGWLIKAGSKDGKVESISIDGKTSFRKGDTFKKKSKVRIQYHSYPEETGK